MNFKILFALCALLAIASAQYYYPTAPVAEYAVSCHTSISLKVINCSFSGQQLEKPTLTTVPDTLDTHCTEVTTDTDLTRELLLTTKPLPQLLLSPTTELLVFKLYKML